jgi:UDP-N-acetylglucosamine--N-acetylmuramyl-(pentapeptide) pyrophosphoryl-undecaprenol N-acetylglucosamine transferase
MSRKVKILLSGGGSGGPVAPLLAILEKFKEVSGFESDILWLGTKRGPEKEMVEREGLEFRAISSGKLRRYFDWRNFSDPFLIIKGFFDSISIIKKYRPDLVMSVGAFVSVPVVWAAALFKIPVIIHQQDARPGLANRLMAPFASSITVAFEKSLKDYGDKAIWVGNPIRQDFVKLKLSRREASQKFGLRSAKPVVAVMGGGTGAKAINDLVEASMDELSKFCQVIHITGQGKATKQNYDLSERLPNYKFFEFLDVFGVIKIFAVADLIVSRCGMSSLTELSQMGKAAILIPMPDSHQEENAEIFHEAGAAVVLHQKDLNKEIFVSRIRDIIQDPDKQKELSENIKKVMQVGASQRIADLMLKILNDKYADSIK